jgi:hypothetical protein
MMAGMPDPTKLDYATPRAPDLREHGQHAALLFVLTVAITGGAIFCAAWFFIRH